MKFRVYVFVLCYVVSITTFFQVLDEARAPAKESGQPVVSAIEEPTAQDVSFEQVERDGTFSGGKIHFDEWAWSGAYLSFSQLGNQYAYLPFLTPDHILGDNKTVRILYKAQFPKGTKESEIDALVKSVVPEELEGCAASLNDEEVYKELIRAGYSVKMPMVTISACPQASAAKTASAVALPILIPIGILCTLIWAFGVYRFILVFRSSYRSRKQDLNDLDNRVIPEAATLGEGVRAVRTSVRHWSLLRESFLDALCHYAPSLMMGRIVKEALPKEFGRLSASVFKEANQARREGHLKDFLRDKAKDPFASSIGIYAILVMLQIVLARSMGTLVALTGFSTFFVSWYSSVRLKRFT